jgi:hypothetical protein
MRYILFCPFGQRDGSVDSFDASVTTYKDTDVDRFKLFNYPGFSPDHLTTFLKSSKVFIRRFRIFSALMSQGVKIYNKGFDGNGADAFDFKIEMYRVSNPTVSLPYYDTKYCPALNEWNDINRLYSVFPFSLAENYGIRANYSVTVDTTLIPAALLSQGLKNDLRFELEIDN